MYLQNLSNVIKPIPAKGDAVSGPVSPRIKWISRPRVLDSQSIIPKSNRKHCKNKINPKLNYEHCKNNIDYGARQKRYDKNDVNVAIVCKQRQWSFQHTLCIVAHTISKSWVMKVIVSLSKMSSENFFLLYLKKTRINKIRIILPKQRSKRIRQWQDFSRSHCTPAAAEGTLVRNQPLRLVRWSDFGTGRRSRVSRRFRNTNQREKSFRRFRSFCQSRPSSTGELSMPVLSMKKSSIKILCDIATSYLGADSCFMRH